MRDTFVADAFSDFIYFDRGIAEQNFGVRDFFVDNIVHQRYAGFALKETAEVSLAEVEVIREAFKGKVVFDVLLNVFTNLIHQIGIGAVLSFTGIPCTQGICKIGNPLENIHRRERKWGKKVLSRMFIRRSVSRWMVS